MTPGSNHERGNSPARQIVRALGGVWTGDHGMARCPSHPDRDPSLSVTDRNGKVLVHCHAECSQQKVIAALRKRGLWPCTACAPSSSEEVNERQAEESSCNSQKRELAKSIWSEATEIDGTLAERYLRSRQITTEAPSSIR